MTAPQNLSATGGDLEGEVDLQWEPVTGRDAYIAEHAASAPGSWTQFYVGNNSSCTATGLNPARGVTLRNSALPDRARTSRAYSSGEAYPLLPQ